MFPIICTSWKSLYYSDKKIIFCMRVSINMKNMYKIYPPTYLLNIYQYDIRLCTCRRHFNWLRTISLFQLTGKKRLSVAGNLGHSTLLMDSLWATYSTKNNEPDLKNLRLLRWAKMTTTTTTMTTIWTWGLNNWNTNNLIIISC